MCVCGCILGDVSESSWDFVPFVVVVLLEVVRGGTGIAPETASRAIGGIKACVLRIARVYGSVS
jgi:hypothetical protein